MKTKRFLAALIAVIMVLTCINLVTFAALPDSAKFDNDMDSITTNSTWPEGIVDRTNKGLRVYSVAGKSGTESDKAFQWYIGNGKGTTNSTDDPDEMKVGQSWAYGIKIPLGTEITNETVVFNCDFLFGSKTIWAPVIRPLFGNATIDALTVKGSELVIQSVRASGSQYIKQLPVRQVICDIEPGEWYNLGAVIKHSSTDGVTIDYYVNSKNVGTYKYPDLKSSALTSFDTYTSGYIVSGDPDNYQTRKDFIVMDNFYIGENVERAYPTDLVIEKVTPADGAKIPVDSTFSIVTNQGVVNFNELTEDAIWLKQNGGNVVKFDSITNGKTVAENDTITGTLSDKLYYSEEYTLNQSKELKNSVGRKLGTKAIRYTTESMFPVTATVNYTKSTGTATAGLSFDGNSKAMKVIMASYDNEGAMVDYDVKDVAAYGNNASLEVSYLNDETIKIFAVDAIDTANILLEPIIDGEKAKSYKQSNTTISLNEAKTFQQVISVEGTTDSVRGWVVAKIAEKGKENSADLKDYLTFDAVQADDNGAFKFAGRVLTAGGKYVYKAIAADSKNSDSGEVEYILGTGTDILSLKLNGKRCIRDGNDFYLKLKNTEVSGLLVEFELPYKAILIANGEILESGATRLNCYEPIELTVRSEIGEEETYTLTVDVEITDQYSDRNENLTVIGGETKYEGEDVVDPGEWVDETRVFTDVSKNYWAMEAIEALYKKGIVAGKGNGTFAPNALITREEFASMVSKAFGFKTNNSRPTFDDIPSGAWYENAVYALADNDIVSGIERHMFGVGRTITRQDMAVILFRVIEGGSVERVRDYKTFADQSKISSYAIDAVNKMYEAGFINGFEDGTFRPAEGTTKAMAAYMIYSIMN